MNGKALIRKLPAEVKQQIANVEFSPNYLRARKAIMECSTVDEVADWANRSAAMATYAKQIQDHSMLDAALRIHARAVERLGDFLSQLAGSYADKRAWAKAHGISDTKFAQATAFSRIPKQSLNAFIEETPAPTASAIAAQARVSRSRVRPESYRSHTEIMRDELRFKLDGELYVRIRSYALQCQHSNATQLARHARGREPDILDNVRTLIDWLDKFERELAR